MKHILIAVVGLLASSAFAQATYVEPTGRLLASGCFQCHGTDGKGGFEKLAGESKAEILEEMKEYQAKSARKDIMGPHGRGYTDAQIEAIATYFASLPKK